MTRINVPTVRVVKGELNVDHAPQSTMQREHCESLAMYTDFFLKITQAPEEVTNVGHHVGDMF
jgi:hypothetical protein